MALLNGRKSRGKGTEKCWGDNEHSSCRDDSSTPQMNSTFPIDMLSFFSPLGIFQNQLQMFISFLIQEERQNYKMMAFFYLKNLLQEGLLYSLAW